jgi:hypothetical protein
LELPGFDLILVALTAKAGSEAEEQLRLLATWNATQHTTTQPRTTQPASPRD